LLQHRLGVPVEPFRPSRSFPCRIDGAADQFDAGGAVALGLALKGIGQDTLGLDFRQEELKVANKFELLKNGLAVTVTLLFLGLLAFSAHCVLKMRELEHDRFEKILDSAYKPFADVAAKYNGLGGNLIEERFRVSPEGVERAGPRPDAVKRFLSELDRMKRKLHATVGGTTGLPPITSALQVWNDIFKALSKHHEEIGYIDFERIEVMQKRVTLMMLVPDITAGVKVQDALKEVPFLQEMKLEDWGVTPATGTAFGRTTFVYKAEQ
jgi:hypothetical protein